MKIALVIALITVFSFGQHQKPKASYKVGKAEVSVWQDSTKKMFKVEKDYMKGGEWKHTSYFNEKELLDLRSAIDSAIKGEGIK